MLLWAQMTYVQKCEVYQRRCVFGVLGRWCVCEGLGRLVFVGLGHNFFEWHLKEEVCNLNSYQHIPPLSRRDKTSWTLILPSFPRIDHSLSAAAMVWDKPMEPGQVEPEWQKRFEVIITHGEAESLEIAQGGFKRIGGCCCCNCIGVLRVVNSQY